MGNNFETYATRTYQKGRVLAFNSRLLLESIYPRDIFPGPPDYENGDSLSVLVKQAWVALEAFEKEVKEK